MDKGIRLSQKHGVNPCLGVCQWCGEEDGTIALLGRLPGDREAPRKAVVSREPCPKCKAEQAKGITLFALADGGMVHGWVVLREEAVARLVSDPAVQAELVKRRYGQVDRAVLAGMVQGPKEKSGEEGT